MSSLPQRLSSRLAWYGIPAVAAGLVIAYVAVMVGWHANPPVVPVQGRSMQPAFQAGDLVILRGVPGSSLRVGDVIAFRTPESARTKYGLPQSLVHRIESVDSDPIGLLLETKGDANPGVDVFKLRESHVLGRVEHRVPAAGLPLLFFRSRQGGIFLAAAALTLAIFFLLGVLEDRRSAAARGAATLQDVLDETRQLRAEVTVLDRAAPTSPELELVSGPPLALQRVAASGAELEAEIRRALASGHDARETLDQLVLAVGEYGFHLQSHTAIVRELAATAAELQRATSGLREVIEALARAPELRSRPESTHPG